MKDEISFLAKRLENEGQKVMTFFSAVTGTQRGKGIYFGIDDWDVKDIIAHFVSSEKSFLLLFENIRNGGQGAEIGFDKDNFNNREVKKLKEYSIESLLAEFSQTRRQMVEWVSRLKETDLQKTGNHPAIGSTTLIAMIRMVYIHNSMHMRDVSQSLGLK